MVLYQLMVPILFMEVEGGVEGELLLAIYHKV